MPAHQSQLEDWLRAAYGEAARTVQPPDVAPDPPAQTRPVHWHGAARGRARRMAPLAAAALVLLVAAATVIPQVLLGGSPPAAAPARPPAHVAYVLTQQQTIVPVDLATGAAGKPIRFVEPGGTVNLVVPPRGTTAYVATVRGDVYPVNLRTGKTERPIRLGGITQRFLMTPNGRLGYALQPPFGVAVVNLATRSPLGFIEVPHAQQFVMMPDGRTVYVLGISGKHVALTPIATATSTTLQPIAVGSSNGLDPDAAIRFYLAVGPGGRTVYVDLPIVGSDAWTKIVPVNTATNTARAPIIVRTPAQGVFLAANGKTAYTAAINGFIPIDLGTGRLLRAIPIAYAKEAVGIGFTAVTSPVTSTMYIIPHGFSTSVVQRIDTATNTALAPVRVGSPRWPVFDLAVSPSGTTLCVLSGYPYVQPESVPDETHLTQVRVSTGAITRTTTLPGNVFLLVFPSAAG
jgi:DNA-binding beta-propeller fold protein YncE